MKIEILYLDGCPNVTATVERLNHILQANSISAPITVTRVDDRITAQSVGFLGSPTVRINGIDVEPLSRSKTDFGLMCRRYDGSGVPSEAIIRRAIAEMSDGD
jgi:hypothetical protein